MLFDNHSMSNLHFLFITMFWYVLYVSVQVSRTNFTAYCADNQKFFLNENDKTDYTEDNREWVGQRNIFNMKEGDTIMSVKGTVRGVKNRVRAGIATFLQDQNRKVKRQLFIMWK